MPQSVAEPVGIEQARALPGLRLGLLRGLPSPWSQAARRILEIEHIPCVRVHPTPDDPPAALYEQEKARSGWAEILLLAERLAANPALDVYWAAFCKLVSPLPAEQLPMPERLRPMFTAVAL